MKNIIRINFIITKDMIAGKGKDHVYPFKVNEV